MTEGIDRLNMILKNLDWEHRRIRALDCLVEELPQNLQERRAYLEKRMESVNKRIERLENE